MNIDDISSDVIPADFGKHDRLDLIFMRQHQLVEKYLPIEKNNGLLICEDVPVNLDNRFGQARLKDFFWRTTEELTEAVDAARVHGHIPSHTFEEMADALHFLVEACILSGIKSTDFSGYEYDQQYSLWKQGISDKLEILHKLNLDWYNVKRQQHATLETYVYEIIHAIGCASNCLKNRPWKQTHQQTDKLKYSMWLKTSFAWLIITFRYLGMNPDQIFAMYFKKSEVNKFRVRSNY